MIKKRVLIIALLAIALILTGCTKKELNLSDYNVIYINVGKADAILIKKEDTNILIDTGTKNTTALEEALKEYNVNKIDILFITHFDKDHVGGASFVIDNYEVDKVYTSYIAKSSDEIDAFIASLKNKNLEMNIIEEDTTITLSNVTYYIYPPESTDYGNNTSNDSSLVIKSIYKMSSFLFAGDIEKDRIKELIKNNIDLSANVIKMPHHGKIEDNSDKLLDIVNPTYAIITSSNAELEDDEIIDLLNTNNIKTYLTRKGTIIVSSDGNSINITQ